jgi:hypothetical protein
MALAGRLIRGGPLPALLAVCVFMVGCEGGGDRATSDVPADRDAPAAKEPTVTSEPAVPETREMGGAKSVTTFFVAGKPLGKGGDLGGLAGADAHCQALAKAEGSGDHTWRAYLSTSATKDQPAVNARDRIGKGPWYNAEGLLIASNLDQLHGANKLDKETAVTERLDPIDGSAHDILTGSRPDGTAFPESENLTCANWTSGGAGRAQVGHHDRSGQGETGSSWNSAHASRGCSEADLVATRGSSRFYCFAVD